MNIQPIVFLRAKRIYLRPLEPEDIPLLVRWINDPDIRKFVASYLPQTTQDEEVWLENLGKRKANDLTFGIALKDTLELIGVMGLHQINHKDGTAQTGAMLGRKDLWGQGYGSEAKMALLGYAFNTLNLRKICSSAYAFNKRSLGSIKNADTILKACAKCSVMSMGNMSTKY